jgi:MFS family permease
VLGAVQAVINAFDMPARQSFLRQMIDDPADLPNAIALNSSMVNGARLLGPLFAAELVAFFGEGWCFAIDAASYIAVIASLLAMKVPKRPITPRTGHVWHEMQEGWRYVMKAPLVRACVLLLAVTSVLGGSYTTLLPMVAKDPHLLGILMASAGVGALAGALYLASRSTVLGLGGIIGRVTIGLGAALMLLRITPNVYFATPLLFVTGMTWMVQMASTNTIIQTLVEPGTLGRVMSLYAVAFFGGMPLGALLEGWLADQIGPMNTFLCAGLAVCLAGALYLRALPGIRAASRPLYIRLGLIKA